MSSKIDWPIMGHTERFDSWSPVLGCLHGCAWNGKGCYADRLHTQRHDALLAGKRVPECYRKPFTEPQVFPIRLSIPGSRCVPTTFFVCSMADLFGSWVPSAWIQGVIDVADANRRHGFMFLTKNPARYRDFEFPLNVMLGTSVATRADLWRVEKLPRGPLTFVSLEPLLDDFTGVKFYTDLIIIGGLTDGRKEYPPKPEHLKSIRHLNVWVKRNAGGNHGAIRAAGDGYR